MTVIVEPPSAQINRKSRKNVEMVVAYRNIRKKVDCVEAQRIMYILNQLQRRLLLLGGFNSLTVEQFKQFPASCHKLRELVSSEDVDEIELANTTRDALREVSENPLFCQLLRRKIEPRVQKQIDLIKQLIDGMTARLTTTQAESDDQIMLTRLANSRRSDIQIQIEKLRGELGAATAEKETETEKRENIIQQLKDDLATVEQVAEENTKSMLDNMEIENKKIQAKSDLTQKKLTDEINPLETDLRKLTLNHREAELELRGRKFRLETEVEGLIAKYDDFMITQQEEIERVQEAYDIEQEELDELRARFEKLSVDYEAIMEERKRIADEEERKRKEYELKTYNATVIQAFFRSYKVRKMLRQKARKAKKGGKKKKG